VEEMKTLGQQLVDQQQQKNKTRSNDNSSSSKDGEKQLAVK